MFITGHISQEVLKKYFDDENNYHYSDDIYLAVIEGISIVSISSILLVTVETIIIGSIKEVGSRCWQTLDSIGIFFVLILIILEQDRINILVLHRELFVSCCFEGTLRIFGWTIFVSIFTEKCIKKIHFSLPLSLRCN